jgi:hypothetical protein
MAPFLKLTSRVINIKQIVEVVKYPNEIRILYNTVAHSGIMLGWYGSITPLNAEHRISKTEDDIDFKTVSDWIEKL